MLDFSNQVVFVTGSSRGIGEACVQKFASFGANVVIHYVKEKERALLLQQSIEKVYGVSTLVVQGDISVEQDVIRMVQEVIHYFGKIDVLVNNAAISQDSYIEEKTKEEFDQVLSVNLVGTFLMTKYVIQEMRKVDSGNVVMIASTNGIDTNLPWSIDYDASKAGVISLAKNFALECAPCIRVNTVAPGWVNTEDVLEMNPDIIEEEKGKCLLKRFASPIEIANVVCFLASEEASFVNKSVIRVDGGIK